jgi:hypothetical protein
MMGIVALLHGAQQVDSTSNQSAIVIDSSENHVSLDLPRLYGLYVERLRFRLGVMSIISTMLTLIQQVTWLQ